MLHEAGVPTAVVQSLIGHDSEEVDQLYVEVGKDALASAAARLPDLGRAWSAGSCSSRPNRILFRL
jgi:hypothetical protein